MIQIPIFYLSLPFDFILHIKSNNIFVNLKYLFDNAMSFCIEYYTHTHGGMYDCRQN